MVRVRGALSLSPPLRLVRSHFRRACSLPPPLSPSLPPSSSLPRPSSPLLSSPPRLGVGCRYSEGTCRGLRRRSEEGCQGRQAMHHHYPLRTPNVRMERLYIFPLGLESMHHYYPLRTPNVRTDGFIYLPTSSELNAGGWCHSPPTTWSVRNLPVSSRESVAKLPCVYTDDSTVLLAAILVTHPTYIIIGHRLPWSSQPTQSRLAPQA